MKTIQSTLTACFMILVSIGYGQKVDRQAEEEKLLELSREWARTAQQGDPKEIVSFWSEDAMLIPPDQPTLNGHSQLAQMIEGASTIPGFEISWEPKKAYVSESGDLGYVLAHKEMKFSDETGKINTTYFIEVGIWQKQENGEWKNTIDIYNVDPTITSIK